MSNSNLPDYMQPHDAEAVTRLVSECLRRGYKVSVNDGEEWTVKGSTSAEEIFSAIASTDMDSIRVRDAQGQKIGTFDLVWGNSPGETICDHTIPEATRAIMEELYDYTNKPWV